MKSSTKLYKMSELCDITSSKRIYAADYKPEGVPFYRGKEIVEKHQGKLDVSTELFIDRVKFEQIRAKFGTPKAGDLLLTSVGTLGVPYVVRHGEEFYFKDGNLTWFTNFRNLDNRFLYYWLLSPQGREQLKKCVIGSSQPAYTIALLKEMEICLPHFPIQRKIAAILSAYDDLIDNNNRRIRILEEMAQLIYREWFVKFRFPGYEKVRMVDSELGPIPEGWEVKRLSDLVDTQYGYTESARDLPVGPKYLRGTDINKNSYIDWDKVQFCTINDEDYRKYKLKQGDILVIRMADPGKVGIVEQSVEAVFASYLIRLKIRSLSVAPYYLFYFLLSDRYQNYINRASTGTTRKSASASVITDISLVIPPKEIIDMFEEIIMGYRKFLNILLKQNTVLRRTRDLLLPKLISGELNVEDLDIAVGGD
ncbi:restriction endonuclease subunit S [Syntrophothermus lipocalidus]|uniref:Restriction modification system DNA specificity domain protein n=1 Tax=Syntrophothermus lipocalidus (strain DSM 12680 / TGB-C1) TaxID=643648 RepID=D7CMG8_SYNLT|nr:restriction endonuclease subunit S [Syntrophothermus lipocalidus]ADI01903.1 restriction modification system DNA specificity domain protein [Syntrophothermus lipocalidus DSM 12680]